MHDMHEERERETFCSVWPLNSVRFRELLKSEIICACIWLPLLRMKGLGYAVDLVSAGSLTKYMYRS
jgi:hypothetical protein